MHLYEVRLNAELPEQRSSTARAYTLKTGQCRWQGCVPTGN